jgi:putative ABC transport system permease protein
VGEIEEGRGFSPLTPANYADVREAATSFEVVTAHWYYELELGEVDPPERVQALYVLEGFFEFTGVPPAVGRALQADDFGIAPSVESGLYRVGDAAVLDHEFWVRRFGSARDVVGRSIRLNDKMVRIVGVMPAGFDALWRDADIYVPWILPPDFWSTRPPHVLPMMARLRAGVERETAAAEVQAIYGQLANEYPETNTVLTADVRALRSHAFGESARAVLILFAGALLVLVVTCTNLAGLLATKARSRTGEIAVRRAVGASQARVARMLLTESFLLASAGAAIGVAAAHAFFRVASVPLSLPFEPTLSVPILVSTALLVGVTAIVLGVAPAWSVARSDVSSALRGVAHGHSSRHISGAFVLVQIALALTLVSWSGLLLTTLTALESDDPVFDSDGVLSFFVILPETRYPDDASKRQFVHRAVEELEAIDGVMAAASASHLPMTPLTVHLATAIEGRAAPRGTFRAAPVFVSHKFLSMMRIPVTRGRDFDERDSRDSPWVIVINERMAREFWPGEPPLGKRIRFEYPWLADKPLTVIGLVPDVRQRGVDQEVSPSFYILSDQYPIDWLYFAVRADRDPHALAPAIRARMSSLDSHLPVADIQTMDERLEASLAPHRARARLASLYGIAALILASVGLNALVVSRISQRAREFVIRMALGATPRHIERLVMSETTRELALGLVLGGGTTLLARRWTAAFLHRVDATAVETLVIPIALIAGSGLLAAFLPTRRASRVSLSARLRQE